MRIIGSRKEIEVNDRILHETSRVNLRSKDVLFASELVSWFFFLSLSIYIEGEREKERDVQKSKDGICIFGRVKIPTITSLNR